MKTHLNVIAALFVFLGCAGIPQPVMSAEPGTNYKFTCMPELGYVEITTVYTEFNVSEEVRQKYNFRYLNDFDCEFDSGAKVTIKFEQLTWDSAVADGKLKGRGWYSYGNDDLNLRLVVIKDGIVVLSIEDFGSSSFDDGNLVPAQFPQFFTYDGTSAKACFGLLTRECRVFNSDK